jgi:hypothetical protein
MSVLEEIIAKGNRGHYGYKDNSVITCADGFHMSVIAGGGTYSTPKPAFCSCYFRKQLSSAYVVEPAGHEVPHDYPGPYTDVEVGFPSMRPEPWGQWEPYCESGDEDWSGSVYGFVPVDMVRALVALHGGERTEPKEQQ